MFGKRKKCATCKTVLKEKNGIHELRINTAEGIVDLEICGDCADFWDKSADALRGRGKDNKDE
jgi:hypothetical protein